MQTSPTITFRNLESSPVVERSVRQRAAELAAYYPRILGCDVIVSLPPRAETHGTFEVNINVTEPAPNRLVSRTIGRSNGWQNVDTAIAEAFEIAFRLLETERHDGGRRAAGPGH